MAVDNVSNQKTIEQIISQSSQKTQDRKTGEMGKDDFLNLLVTQLKYQDPLQPVDDKEFIGQMAQFSSLEQMQNMNTSTSQSQAYSLIGKNVTATYVDDTTNESSTINGDVTSVKVDKGKITLMVKGKEVPLEGVTNITQSYGNSSDNLSSFTNLIGTISQGGVYDSATGDIVGVGGIVKSIEKGTNEDYAVMDNVPVEISQIVTKDTVSDPNFNENYLKENLGKTVDVKVTNRDTGKEVPVTATLKDYSIDSQGHMSATLDDLYVPVDSVASIKKGTSSNASAYTDLIGFNVKGSIHDAKYTNNVNVSGNVKSIEAGQYEDYAITDGVQVEIAGINENGATTDLNYKENYLQSHMNDGSNVSVIIRDGVTGQKVPVAGKLAGFNVDNDTGKITATLDSMMIPVNSISNIQK